jgi:hypothetical protein
MIGMIRFSQVQGGYFRDKECSKLVPWKLHVAHMSSVLVTELHALCEWILLHYFLLSVQPYDFVS